MFYITLIYARKVLISIYPVFNPSRGIPESIVNITTRKGNNITRDLNTK